MSVTNLTKIEVIDQKKKLAFVRRQSLLVNAVSNWVSLAVSTVVAFFLTPYLINNLGKDNYGIWALLGSIVGVYGLLELGVSSAVMRYVAYYLGREDHDSLNATFNTALVLFCGVGALCVVLAFLLVRPLSVFFAVPDSDFINFQHSLWFLGLAAAIGFPSNVLRTVVLSHEQFVPCNIVRITAELLRPCLCVALIKLGYGLQGIAFATLTITLISLFGHIVSYRLFCPFTTLRPDLANWISIRQLLVYGLPAAVVTLGAILQVRLDNVVIGKWLNMSSVTDYAVGAMLVNLLARTLGTASSVLDPRLSHLAGAEDRETILKLYLRSLGLLTSLAFSIGVALILVGEPFILLWLGKGYEKSYWVLVLLVAARMTHASQYPTMSLIFALNRHRIYAGIVLVEGMANLGLSVLFVRWWGIVGVAMGTMIPMVLCKMFVLPLYAKTQAHVSARRLYLINGRPIFLILILGILARYFFHPSSLSWPQTIGAFCALTLIFLTVANYLGQSREHRVSFAEIRDRFISFL